jgi:hypothetical protein
MVIVLAIGTIAIVTFLPVSASAAVPPGCSAPVVGASNSSISVHCNSTGRGSRFQIRVQECTTANCGNFYSAWANYGGTAKVTAPSTAGVIPGSLVIYWASATGTGCAFTQLGGTISWCDMQANIQNWANRGIVYCETCGDSVSDWYKDRNYRPDCSGLVSMAWHISVSPTPYTGNIENYAHAVTWAYNATSLSYIRPGDLLNDVSDGHAVMFAGWASDHVHFSVWSFGNGTMSNGHLFTNQPYVSGSTQMVAGWPKAHYAAFRYNHATGTTYQ